MTSLTQAIADVAAFHEACDVPVLDKPAVPTADRRVLRRELIREEFQELTAEMHKDRNSVDLANLGKEIADLIVVLIGTALEYGLPLDEIWDEVHRSNMSKLDPETGKAVKRSDGKVLKGPNYRPADIRSIVEKASSGSDEDERYSAIPCALCEQTEKQIAKRTGLLGGWSFNIGGNLKWTCPDCSNELRTS